MDKERYLCQIQLNLLYWANSVVLNAIKTDEGNCNGKLFELLEHYTSMDKPIYFFLSEGMSFCCKEELSILSRNKHFLKNVVFVLGVDQAGEYNQEMFEQYLNSLSNQTNCESFEEKEIEDSSTDERGYFCGIL